MGFGSGVVEPSFGISLQNRGHGFSLDAGQPEPRGAGQAAVPHHHPGLPDEGRPAGDELRRDGRQHAAAGPHADAGAHARLRPEPAGRLRRAALALQRRAGDQRRARHARGHACRACSALGHARRRASTTATRTSAPASSSGAWATRRSRATWPPATRAATAWRPASEARASSAVLSADTGCARRARPAAGHGRRDRLLRQGHHRQAGLPPRRRCGHADHVPHAVRAAAVPGAGLVGRARQAGADARATGASSSALGFSGYYLASFSTSSGLQYISASLERLILYLNPTLVLLLSAAAAAASAIAARQAIALARQLCRRGCWSSARSCTLEGAQRGARRGAGVRQRDQLCGLPGATAARWCSAWARCA